MSAKGGGSAEEDAGREEFVGYTGKFYDPKGTNFLARAGSTDQHPGGLGTTVQNIPNKLGEAGRPVVELAAANCVLDVDDLPSVLPQGLAQASHSHARCAELADAIPDGIMVFLGIGPGELYTWSAYPTGCNTEEAKAASTRKVRDDILAGIKGPPALPHALPDVLYTSAVPLSACALVDALKSAGITYVLYHRERIHGTLRSFRDLDMYSQRGHDLVCDLARSSPELGWLKRWNAYQIDGTFVTDRVWVVGVYAGEDSLSNATVTPLYPGLLKASYGMIEATNLELGHHSNIVAVKISPRHEGQQRWFGASFEKPNAEYYGGAVKLLEYCKSSLLEVDNAAKGIGGLTMRLTVKATRPIEAWRECEHSGIFSPLQMLQALGECKDYENQTWYPVHGITTQVIKAHGQRLIEAGLNLMSRFAGNGLTSSTNRNNLRDCMAAVGQTSDGKGANTSFVEGQEVWWVYQESKATTTASKRKGPARNKGSLMPPDTKHATGQPARDLSPPSASNWRAPHTFVTGGKGGAGFCWQDPPQHDAAAPTPEKKANVTPVTPSPPAKDGPIPWAEMTKMKEKVKIQKFRTSPATYQWFDPKGELHPPPSDARPYYTKEDMFARGVWPEYKSDWMNKVALIPEAENVLDESDTMDTEQTEPVDD